MLSSTLLWTGMTDALFFRPKSCSRGNSMPCRGIPVAHLKPAQFGTGLTILVQV